MNASFRVLTAIAILFAVSMAWPVYGQGQVDSSDDWEIHFEPYLYMLSLDAKGTVSGLSGSLDIGFDDVVDHLDMAAMGRIEAWKINGA